MNETQISFDSVLAPEAPQPSPSVPAADAIGNSTGCCSRYRECSSVGQCVVPDKDYALECLYRKNLKAGRVFYGENANGFSSEKYLAYQRRVDELSPAAHSIFDRLLICFFEYYRGARSVIVRSSTYLEEIFSLGLFSFERLGSNFPPRKSEQWDYQKILGHVLSSAYYAPLFQNAQAVRAEELRPLRTLLKEARDRKDVAEVKRLSGELTTLYKTKPGERTKEFLRQWLNSEAGIPLRDVLSEPYRLVYIPPEHAPYAEELWNSSLLSSYDERVYWNTPYYEDGILSSTAKKTEEDRRIRLSRGYTTDEKQALLSALSEVQTDTEPDPE